MSSGSSSNKLLPPSFHTVPSPREGVCAQPPLRSGASPSPPLQWGTCKLKFFMEDCFFSPFTNFFSRLYQSGTLGYIFYTEVYNPVLLCSFSCSNCFRFSHWELFEEAPVSFCRTPLGVGFARLSVGALPHFLAPRDAPDSSCTFPVPVPESASSPGIPGSS